MLNWFSRGRILRAVHASSLSLWFSSARWCKPAKPSLPQQRVVSEVAIKVKSRFCDKVSPDCELTHIWPFTFVVKALRVLCNIVGKTYLNLTRVSEATFSNYLSMALNQVLDNAFHNYTSPTPIAKSMMAKVTKAVKWQKVISGFTKTVFCKIQPKNYGKNLRKTTFLLFIVFFEDFAAFSLKTA